jgi:hypothetical protein
MKKNNPLSREFLLQRGYCCHIGCLNCPYIKHMHIDTELKELKDTWGYTIEELNHIKIMMANYALKAMMDSSVRKEVEIILQEEEK